MAVEVVTRCHPQRPTMLARNQASLAVQTCGDWFQTLLRDDMGRGVAWANANLSRHVATGDYVWVLDDDDECVRPTLVEEIGQIADSVAPDVIMVRMDHGRLGVLPSDELWGARPVQNRIGSSAIVCSRDTWNAHAAAWDTGSALSGDYGFIDAVFDSEPRVYWHDVIASRVQRISKGAAE